MASRARDEWAARASAADVARAGGVSKATVSYVMNGRGGVSVATRRRILSLANDLGYRPRVQDPSNTQLTRVIALILPTVANNMFNGWAEHIISAANHDGFDVFVATSQDNPVSLNQTAKSLAARSVDGVVIAALLRQDSTALTTFQQHRIPYVCLSRRSDYGRSDFIGIDDAAAARELMNHFLWHGYHDIATVIGPRASIPSLQRETAFANAAATAGTPIPSQRRISTNLDRRGGMAAAKSLFSPTTNLPRAVVCGSDEIALGVMEHLLLRGLRIPDDVAVGGSDGTAHSRSDLIGLTTILQPVRKLAINSYRLLMHRLRGYTGPADDYIYSHTLHIGQTCGCTYTRTCPDNDS